MKLIAWRWKKACVALIQSQIMEYSLNQIKALVDQYLDTLIWHIIGGHS